MLIFQCDRIIATVGQQGVELAQGHEFVCPAYFHVSRDAAAKGGFSRGIEFIVDLLSDWAVLLYNFSANLHGDTLLLRQIEHRHHIIRTAFFDRVFRVNLFSKSDIRHGNGEHQQGGERPLLTL